MIVAGLFPAVLDRGVGGGELGVEGILSYADVEPFLDLLVVEFRLTGRGETINTNKLKKITNNKSNIFVPKENLKNKDAF